MRTGLAVTGGGHLRDRGARVVSRFKCFLAGAHPFDSFRARVENTRYAQHRTINLKTGFRCLLSDFHRIGSICYVINNYIVKFSSLVVIHDCLSLRVVKSPYFSTCT